MVVAFTGDNYWVRLSLWLVLVVIVPLLPPMEELNVVRVRLVERILIDAVFVVVVQANDTANAAAAIRRRRGGGGAQGTFGSVGGRTGSARRGPICVGVLPEAFSSCR